MQTVKIRMIIGAMMATACLLPADEGARLPTLKEMYLNTPVVHQGRAAVVIVAPALAEGMRAAELIRDGIAVQTGVRPAITPDDDGSVAYLERGNVILIGNLMTGKLAARLYCMWYLDVDAAWPGPGGYLLQTIHNPLGNGYNVISIGASDPAGFLEGAMEFLKKTGQGSAITVPPLYELKTGRTPPDKITPAVLEKLTANLVGEGKTHAVGGLLSAAGWNFAKWRMPGHAKLFRRGMELLWQDLDRKDAYDDMRMIKYLPLIWDKIEESACFSEADRKYISDCLYVYAQKGKYARLPSNHWELASSPTPHGNNWNAEATYMAGMYFSKYYPELPLGRELMVRMDYYYHRDLEHWKVAESAPGYGAITWNANINYALTRPRMAYFESGKVRQAADYAVIITDNRGIASGFGDDLGKPYAAGILPVAAWYYRDGGYLWWFNHIGGEKDRFMADYPEAPPARLLGIKYAPLDRWLYERKRYNPSGARKFPLEECFDKMSFRAGFEKTNQYLCLSGVSYGFHSHPDGNAIVNFARNDRQFLYDNGYQIPEVTEHNTVIVYRAGLAADRPDLARLAYCGDFGRVGITATDLLEYNGADWRRNIIWKKDRYFLVSDALAAREADNFGFQCIWRTLGRVELRGREMRAEQDEDVFRLINLDGAAQGLKECNPKHAHVTRLVQTIARDLKSGAQYCFGNLFFSESVKNPEDIEAHSMGGEIYGIRDGQSYELAGRGAWSDKQLAIDAEAFWLMPGYAAGAGVKAAGMGDVAFKAGQIPVSCEIDLEKGEACFITRAKTAIEFMGEKITLPAGETRRRFQARGRDEIASYGSILAQAFNQAAPVRAELEKTAATKGSMFAVPAWSYDDFDLLVDYPARVLAGSVPAMTEAEVGGAFSPGELEALIRPNASVIFPAGEEVAIVFDLLKPRVVRQIRLTAKQLESFAGGCGLKSAHVQLSEDNFKDDVRYFGGMLETNHPGAIANYVIAAELQSARYVKITLSPMSSGHKVYLDQVVVRGLTRDAPELKPPVRFASVAVADLDGDGADEIIAAADRHIYGLNTEGRLLWKTRLEGVVFQVAAGDLDGDGKDEVAVGCDDRTLSCLDAAGKIRWKYPTPVRSYDLPGYRGYAPRRGNPKVVFPADVDGDGKQEIIMGCDSNLRTFCLDSGGSVIWDAWNEHHSPTCGYAYDLNGDGIQEIIMGNEYYNIRIYDGRAGRIIANISMTWHAGPSAVLADDLDNDGKAEIVVGDRAGRIRFKAPWDCNDGKNDKNARLTETGALITFVRAADLDLDKRKEVLVGSENGYVYLFAADGSMRWRRNLGEVPRDAAFMDCDNCGKPEILAGVEDGTLRVLDENGNERFRVPANGAVRYVKVCARGDRPPIIVLATDACEILALTPGAE